jgi:microsomal dipeptidase-like Zn-dependent dipeptidase
MNRRQFLIGSAACGASLAFCGSCSITTKDRSIVTDPLNPGDLRVIDAHAHPDQFYGLKPGKVDRSSTIEQMVAMGMEASVFAALGDHAARGRSKSERSEFQLTLIQLRRVCMKAADGRIRLVLNAADVPEGVSPGGVPGAILAVEGGEALEGCVENVERFHQAGVRLITLIHQLPNGLGDSVNKDPEYGGLTRTGAEMVEAIQETGIVLDAAHATASTLKDIVRISRSPIIDSHTVKAGKSDSPKRFRSWEEMELVAGTDGVVCTCPWRTKERKTFHDWAKEILLMKDRIGVDHVGLGTDGGGNLPELIRGYRDIRDLVHLVEAMHEVGLGTEDVRKYMGGNFFRVLERCLKG